MTRTPSLLLALALVLLACSRPRATGPRYSAHVFSEDTVAATVTVAVTGTMQASLTGAGYYAIDRQPVVLTPATLVLAGIGSATISAVDSMQLISLVPPGTHPDSTDRVAVIGRMLRVTRVEGQPEYKLEVTRP